MDPLQWMGAIRMRVQTADKNITTIHLKSSMVKICVCVFVRNVYIIKMFYNIYNIASGLKKEPIIHNNSSSGEKVHLLTSSDIKVQQHACSELFRIVFTC